LCRGEESSSSPADSDGAKPLSTEIDAAGTHHNASSIALSLWSDKLFAAGEIQDVSVVFFKKTLIDGGCFFLGRFERLVKAIKFEAAYFRSLYFSDPPREKAEAVYAKTNGSIKKLFWSRLLATMPSEKKRGRVQ
jgi:hypothetical protein